MSRVCEDGQEHLTAETGVGLGARRSLSLVRLGAVQMPRWSLLESLQETEKVGRECRRVNKNAFVRKQTPALAFTYNSRHCVFPSVSVSGLPIPIAGIACSRLAGQRKRYLGAQLHAISVGRTIDRGGFGQLAQLLVCVPSAGRTISRAEARAADKRNYG